MTSNDASSQSLLAVHPGALGDVILFGRLIERLRLPTTLIAAGEKARLLAGLGVVGRTLDYESLPMHELFMEPPPANFRLSNLLGCASRVIGCLGNDPTAQRKLGQIVKANRCEFLPIRPEPGENRHLVDVWLEMLGLRSCSSWPVWQVPDAWLRSTRELLLAAGSPGGLPYVVLHPGAGSLNKCWPTERFIALAAKLITQYELQAFIVLGPAELERGLIPSSLPSAATLVRSPRLQELAGLLKDACLFIGNDSGCSHLAAAVGAPTVAIFGPTRHEHFAPLGPRVDIVQGPHDIAQLDFDAVFQASCSMFEAKRSSTGAAACR